MSISSIGSSSSSVDQTEMRKKMAERMAERMMKDLDTDGDGAISKAELQQAKIAAESSKKPGSDSSTSLDDLFNAIDSGSDGSITKDELVSFMQKVEPKGPPPGGPPPGGPPPGGAPPAGVSDSDESTEESSSTENERVQNRQAFAYQQLMALLRNLGDVAQPERSATSVSVSG